MRYQILVNTKGMAISCYREVILLISGKIVIKQRLKSCFFSIAFFFYFVGIAFILLSSL